MKKIVTILIGLLLLSACGKGDTGTNNPAPANKPAATPGEPKLSEAKPPTFSTNSPPDTAEAVKFPFADFPKTDTAAKPGEYVLAPSYNWVKDAADKGAESTSFIWYVQKMATPDKENSRTPVFIGAQKGPECLYRHDTARTKGQDGGCDLDLVADRLGDGSSDCDRRQRACHAHRQISGYRLR